MKTQSPLKDSLIPNHHSRLQMIVYKSFSASFPCQFRNWSSLVDLQFCAVNGLSVFSFLDNAVNIDTPQYFSIQPAEILFAKLKCLKNAIEQSASPQGNQPRRKLHMTDEMSFLNGRVSPEPLCSDAVVETELTDSFSHDKGTDFIYNNNEGMETSIADYRSAKECQESTQEELDDIPEDQIYFTSDQFQDEKTSRPGSQSSKRLAWNTKDASPKLPKRFHGCDRVVLLTVCVMSAASVVLTLLMMLGILGPLNCACSGKTGSGSSVPNADYTELSKNVRDLKQNMSSLRETSDEIVKINNLREPAQIALPMEVKRRVLNISVACHIAVRPELEEMRKKYDDMRKRYDEMRKRNDEMRNKYDDMKIQVTALQGKNLSAESNKSESYSDKDNITALWQAIQTNRQEIIQLDQKIINASKTQGPRGPPGPSGYNGTQGPPGKTGTSGSPGPSGPGNLSLCSYNEKTGDAPVSAGSGASTDVSVTETKGKKFLGVNCGTNDASVISLSSNAFPDGRRIYKCLCQKSVGGGGTMYCYIHYWECPT